jgi:hypothetical protein
MAPTGAVAALAGALATLAGAVAALLGAAAALPGTVATLTGGVRKFIKANRKTSATRAKGMTRLTTNRMGRMTNSQSEAFSLHGAVNHLN